VLRLVPPLVVTQSDCLEAVSMIRRAAEALRARVACGAEISA
jgi:acetylornithine/succinyldiaminopimelate/putrescine aminotransferase